MAYENKPRTISDKDKGRSEEERRSLFRQRDRRELNKKNKELKEERDQALSRTANKQDRSEIKAKADAALEQANANFNEKYYPSRNKDDYESDILQRGIDQFNAPEATPESSGSGGGGDGLPEYPGEDPELAKAVLVWDNTNDEARWLNNYYISIFQVVKTDNTVGTYKFLAQEVPD